MFEASAYTPDIIPTPPMTGPATPYGRAYEHVSATGRSTVPAGTPGYAQLVNSLQRNEGFGHRRGHGQYTRIDIERIRIGNDVRTTVSPAPEPVQPKLTLNKVMLRNIPNRVTQAQLKEIVDQTSFGAYDFMYLRIGMYLQHSHPRLPSMLTFSQISPTAASMYQREHFLCLVTYHSSVGYAFINFVEVSFLPLISFDPPDI
jgi:RNA recognition motif 2